jgi:hypothetical protein
MEIRVRDTCPACEGRGCDACDDGHVERWVDADELAETLATSATRQAYWGTTDH